MFIYKVLEKTDSIRYESLTFQYARSRLQGLDEWKSSGFAIGAEQLYGGRQPEAVGLIVIDYRIGHITAEVVSLFVKAQFRRRGIATELLRHAEAFLQKLGCAKLSLAYYSGKAITPALEAFLSQASWTEPIPDGKVYTADTRIASAPWVRKTAMPGGLRSFYWHELSREEDERLLGLEGELYPTFLSPFKSRHPLEKSNSLGLRFHGETVGWCITYRIAEDTLLYDSVFITPPYRLSGCAFMLIAQSIAIQLESGVPYAIFAVNNKSPFMRKMLDRWLIPYTTRLSEKKVAYKTLSLSGG